MGRGSGSIRPHLSVLLLLTGVLAGLLLRTPVPSVPTPLPQGEVGERIAAALPAELSPLPVSYTHLTLPTNREV